MMRRLKRQPPRLAVAALNPHAGDGGLFGDEEARLLVPAVRAAQAEGIPVTGPWPSDTLFVRARGGEFDGIVAMYHDQGHIALKLLGGLYAVNITVGEQLASDGTAGDNGDATLQQHGGSADKYKCVRSRSAFKHDGSD